MSAFDFGDLSERRRLERQAKQRRRIAIGLGVGLVVAIIISSGAFAIAYQSKRATSSAGTNGVDEDVEKKQISTSSKASTVKIMCAATDYKQECESSLSKAMGSNGKPKDILKAAISVVSDEVKKAFHNASVFQSDDPMVKGAIADCGELYEHSKDELANSLSDIIDGHKFATKSDDLKNWMSAVLSYQETCIDGFPEGELKSKLKNSMTTAKKMTSNALAIINQASSILSTLNVPGFIHRRLLEEGSNGVGLDKGGFPIWMSHEDRRILKEHKLDLKPNAVVAKDGSGDYTTINDALNHMPKTYKGRYVIYVKAGTYDEQVTVTKNMVNVTMFGDGSRKTIITGNKNFVDGTRTFQTATFAAIGDGFMANSIGFQNTAGAIKHQAVALRVQSDRSIFLNCRMDGYQDTLYAQTHRQYYRGCVITGTIDFIFGDAAAVFQNCIMVVRKPLDNQQNIVTAQGRIDRHETTGIVIHNCKIKADEKLVPMIKTVRSYLGRPWKEYSRTIIMESTIGDLIHPDGWLPWEGDFALKTLEYGEYNNEGPGAKVTARVKWPGYKVINRQQATQYTVENFIQGGEWIKVTGTPVRMGLLK